MNSLENSLDYLSSNLFGEESDHFEKVRNRLEGYELAYEVILESNKRIEKENKSLKEKLSRANSLIIADNDLIKGLEKEIKRLEKQLKINKGEYI